MKPESEAVELLPIRRALLSVSDKSGIAELGRALHGHGCELIASGGTAAELGEAGLPVTPVEQVSGSPQAFEGRMKTLSFPVASSVLFDRHRDAAEAERLGISPIDMVVCSFYPFAEKWYSEEKSEAELIELIDIGGPTMVRAAAKNFRFVTVLTQPIQYRDIIDELDRYTGCLGLATRRSCMRRAFSQTAAYEAAIASAMDELAGQPSLRLTFENGTALRYGENSHQRAWVYRRQDAAHSLYDLELLHGSELSYNNLSDLQAAVEAVADQPQAACAVIKHGNPCGLATASTQLQALQAAWAGDPISAFGSVIAFNQPLEEPSAAFFELDHPDKKKRKFIEVIAAPLVPEPVVQQLQIHKRLRVVQIDPSLADPTSIQSSPENAAQGYLFKYLSGAVLLQEPDAELFDGLRLVTEHEPPVEDRELVEFGLRAVRSIKSNAIAVVRRLPGNTLQLLGMGAGQPNRVTAVQLAMEKCRENLQHEQAIDDSRQASTQSAPIDQAVAATGHASAALPHTKNPPLEQQLGSALLVSDAFFPFPDNIELLAEAGIRTVVQPGGSIRDKSVIRRANELGVAMFFSQRRHFKH